MSDAAQELPLGLEPLPPGLDRVIDGGDRPGLRVGERDGLVRRADGMVAARPEQVKDAFGLTALERTFVELLFNGHPETGEALLPAQAYVLAGGSQSSARTSAAALLVEPRILEACQRQAGALVVARGIPAKAAELIDLTLSAELEAARYLQERGRLREYSPSRVAAVFTQLAVSLSGMKAPERAVVDHRHVHDVGGTLKDRLDRAHRRKDRARAPELELVAEAVPPAAEAAA